MIHLLPRTTSVLSILLLIIAAGSAGVAYYFYQQYEQAQRRVHDPEAVAREEVKSLVDKISTFIALPINEEPTMVTVSDTGKLREQPFFTRAENGDKVLIYAQAKKVILYRPSIKKIIDVAPINISTPDASPNPISFTP